jgi:cytochrome c556
MGVSKTDGTGVAPAAQPAPKPEAAPAAAAPAAAPKNEPLVKRWQAGEVPAAASGNATVFEAKSGGGPAAAAAPAPAKGPAGPTPGSYPTVADTQRIADNPDGAARNLDITQAYSDLSKAMGQVVGSDNANWSTFATWASKQAGVSIRGEDVPKALTDAIRGTAGFQDKVDQVNGWLKKLGMPQIPDLPGRLAQKMAGAMDQVQGAIADGNQRVFKEIAPEFTKFIDTFKGDTKYDQAKVDRYLQHFQPGQEKLRDAFANYAKAQFETDPKKKAELMLLGNNQIGMHEQTRLQPDIMKALNAPIDQVLKPALKKIIRDTMSNAGPFGSGKWAYDKLDKAGLIDKAISPVLNGAASAWRQVATDQLMTLATPGGTLKLGSDVPKGFPKNLQTIDNPDLQKVLGQVDRTPNTTKGSAGNDWASFNDRMNYIVDLFRAYGQDPSLFNAPFPGRSGSYSKGSFSGS